jgi:hypothetical protein
MYKERKFEKNDEKECFTDESAGLIDSFIHSIRFFCYSRSTRPWFSSYWGSRWIYKKMRIIVLCNGERWRQFGVTFSFVFVEIIGDGWVFLCVEWIGQGLEFLGINKIFAWDGFADWSQINEFFIILLDISCIAERTGTIE